jgi:conjugal transfer pilus assembly protein TraL
VDYKDSYIPQHLDVPTRYVFFTSDELVFAVVPVAISIFFNAIILGLIAAGVAVWAIRKVKQGTSLSRIYDRAYWLLPARLFQFKDTPGSDLRDLAG